eukprot:403342230
MGGSTNSVYNASQFALNHINDAGMIMGPCIGFIIQGFKMKKEQNSDGFSPLVCLILLTANILRIFWWYVARFSEVLLIAAMLMVLCQFVLLYLWVSIRLQNQKLKFDQVEVEQQETNSSDRGTPSKDKKKLRKGSNLLNPINDDQISLINSSPSSIIDTTADSEQIQHQPEELEESFWYWNQFSTYLVYIGALTLVILAMTLLLKQFPMYVTAISFLSSGIEALLGVPQFWLNYQRKNTQGLAVILILIWLCGDLYKFSYYASNNSPIALVCCAFFQICTDICILSQFWLYRNNKSETQNKSSAVGQNIPSVESATIEIDQQSSDDNHTNGNGHSGNHKANSSNYSVISTKSGQSSPGLDQTADEEDPDMKVRVY